jgi:cell division protein FtsZ
MFETAYRFDIPRHHKSIIKVIGVGGGGSNAVNHMYRLGIKDVEFVVCNTDLQALNTSPIPNKLQIGANLTEGLGCGANPDVGRAAAIESKDQIRELLAGTKMVFITAGMGGGTGTGAAPVIAKIAKDMDILTVGIVTVPFNFEGRKKFSQAQSGVDALRDACDTVLVILNDKLREMYGNLAIGHAFGQADNVLTTAAKGIAEIITLAGYVNVDFQDVRTVMLNAGAAVMGSAESSGEGRARRAAVDALTSPLLDNKDIMGAKRILLSIVSGEEAELQMDELSEITEYIQEQAGDNAEVIFGHGIDASLGDKIRVTVIATGFVKEPVTKAEPVLERKVMGLEDPGQVESQVADNPVELITKEPELKMRPQDHPAYEPPRVAEPQPAVAPVELKVESVLPPPPQVVETVMTIEPPKVAEPEPTVVQFEERVEPKLPPQVVESMQTIEPPKEEPPAVKEIKWEVPVPVPVAKKDEPTPEPPAPKSKPRIVTWEPDLFSSIIPPREEPREEIKAKPEPEPQEIEDLGEPALFRPEDDFDYSKEEFRGTEANETVHLEMPGSSTRQRLEQQAKERKEKIKGARRTEMSKEEFMEKWQVPSFLRRGVKLEDVPHSSEPYISRYNLNDENNLFGNNKFLHDNVD